MSPDLSYNNLHNLGSWSLHKIPLNRYTIICVIIFLFVNILSSLFSHSSKQKFKLSFLQYITRSGIISVYEHISFSKSFICSLTYERAIHSNTHVIILHWPWTTCLNRWSPSSSKFYFSALLRNGNISDVILGKHEPWLMQGKLFLTLLWYFSRGVFWCFRLEYSLLCFSWS